MVIYATKANGDLRDASIVNSFIKKEAQKNKPIFLSFDDTWNGVMDIQWMFDIFAGIERYHCRVIFDGKWVSNAVDAYLFCRNYFDLAPVHDHWIRHEEVYRRERNYREFQRAAEIVKQAKKNKRKYH